MVDIVEIRHLHETVLSISVRPVVSPLKLFIICPDKGEPYEVRAVTYTRTKDVIEFTVDGTVVERVPVTDLLTIIEERTGREA